MISDFSTRVIAPDHVMVQEIDGQSALLNVQSEKYFGLDDVGTRMWMVITKADSLNQACATLEAEYDVEPSQLRDDIARLVEQLVEHDLVVLESPSAAA